MASITRRLVRCSLSDSHSFNNGERCEYGAPNRLISICPWAVFLGISLDQFLRASKSKQLIAGSLLLIHLVSFAVAYPHFSTYFNLIKSSPYNAQTIVADSNIDWGQDWALVGQFIREHDLESINLALDGPNLPQVWGIENYRWIHQNRSVLISTNPVSPNPNL